MYEFFIFLIPTLFQYDFIVTGCHVIGIGRTSDFRSIDVNLGIGGLAVDGHVCHIAECCIDVLGFPVLDSNVELFCLMVREGKCYIMFTDQQPLK